MVIERLEIGGGFGAYTSSDVAIQSVSPRSASMQRKPKRNSAFC
jgi:hypothetical protein